VHNHENRDGRRVTVASGLLAAAIAAAVAQVMDENASANVAIRDEV
jgi:hypothetical protein